MLYRFLQNLSIFSSSFRRENREPVVCVLSNLWKEEAREEGGRQPTSADFCEEYFGLLLHHSLLLHLPLPLLLQRTSALLRADQAFVLPAVVSRNRLNPKTRPLTSYR